MYRNKSGLQEQKPGGELTRLILSNRETTKRYSWGARRRVRPHSLKEQSPCHPVDCRSSVLPGKRGIPWFSPDPRRVGAMLCRCLFSNFPACRGRGEDEGLEFGVCAKAIAITTSMLGHQARKTFHETSRLKRKWISQTGVRLDFFVCKLLERPARPNAARFYTASGAACFS